MTALLEKVRAKGIGVELEGSRLKIVNASKLSDQQREWLRVRKPQIILELQAEQKPAIPEAVEPVADSAENLPPLLNIAEILSIIDGSDEKETTRRLGELLARPRQVQVSCADCQHFAPDTVGDGSGIGNCAVNAATLGARWPNSRRYCLEFSGKKTPNFPMDNQKLGETCLSVEHDARYKLHGQVQ